MTVWILEASQGSYSDRRDWIVNVYSTLEAALTDPGNKDINLSPTSHKNCYVGLDSTSPSAKWEEIYYTLNEHEVLGSLKKPSYDLQGG